MHPAASGPAWTAKDRDDWDAAEGSRKADDLARGYLLPTAEQCGVDDEQLWIDLCA